MSELVKMFVVLTAICLLSSFALTALNRGLAEQIASQEEFYVRGPAVLAVYGIELDDPHDPLGHAFTAEVDGQPWRFYPWIENGTCTAVAMETVGQGGYSGNVSVMTAVDFTSGEINGVRVTGHSETPGVGTRVAEPSYLRSYSGLPITGTTFRLQTAGGDIAAVSGATYTSTAVVDGVSKAVQFILQHKDEIPKWAAENRSGS
ncbi:MAG: FMN-binding protein [Candidatus Eisenbacteria sp.]|nr:FMN-binding protein [Candidatus Eisenbacteria bacterium]